MIKRIAAYILLFTATIVLLADSFIPHHHHGDRICFENSHCCPDNHSVEFPIQSNHNHNNEDDCGSCKLKQTIMLTSNHQFDDLFNSIKYKAIILGDLLPVNSHITLSPELHTISWFQYCKFLLIFKQSDEDGFSGLRAPPIA